MQLLTSQTMLWWGTCISQFCQGCRGKSPNSSSVLNGLGICNKKKKKGDLYGTPLSTLCGSVELFSITPATQTDSVTHADGQIHACMHADDTRSTHGWHAFHSHLRGWMFHPVSPTDERACLVHFPQQTRRYAQYSFPCTGEDMLSPISPTQEIHYVQFPQHTRKHAQSTLPYTRENISV